MRRNLAWAVVLFVSAALAVPAAAADRAAPTAIQGKITNAATGLPFVGGTIAVDAFDVATGVRKSTFAVDGAGHYTLSPLDPGTYKVRFRVWDGSDELIRYRWNDDKAAFRAADPVVVAQYATVTVDASLRAVGGAPVSGTLAESGSGAPLATGCFSVHLFEAGGIGMGWITWAGAAGKWEIPFVPAGRWTALAYVITGVVDPDGDGGQPPVDCGTGPSHLDTWYGGASGWPLSQGVVAHARTFPTADVFVVDAGIPLTGIDIALPAAPTCRGRTPTMFGTTLADTIIGTTSRDIISGLAGGDTIKGLGGNDLLCGDSGNDTLIGGAGLKDTAVGGPGGGDDCTAETRIGCELP
jgi:hypothetical protein